MRGRLARINFPLIGQGLVEEMLACRC